MNVRDLGDQMNNPDYLRARLADIEARRNNTPNDAGNLRDDMFPPSSRTPVRNYHESTNPLAASSGQQAHYSGKFLIPRDMEGLRVQYGGQMPLSIVTHEVVVDTVTIPTYDNLIKLQKQLETGWQKGHRDLIRNSYISDVARRAIDDAYLRSLEIQQGIDSSVIRRASAGAREEEEIVWLLWNDTEFFKVIPPLMRMGSIIQRDPIDDCLTQIAKLQYTYYDNHNTGESELHENTLTVFRHTRMWTAQSNDESQAKWILDVQNGKRWLRNIINALNNVIEKGRGTATQIAIIAAEMKFKENNYASARIGDYFFLFKRVAYEKQQLYFMYHED